jgi:hypothetical protein
LKATKIIILEFVHVSRRLKNNIFAFFTLLTLTRRKLDGSTARSEFNATIEIYSIVESRDLTKTAVNNYFQTCSKTSKKANILKLIKFQSKHCVW